MLDRREAVEQTVSVKLKLIGSSESIRIRSLVFLLPDVSFHSLTSDVLRVSSEMDGEIHEAREDDWARESNFRIELRYVDNDGDTVIIGSEEELVNAIPQRIIAGTFQITAMVTKFIVNLHLDEETQGSCIRRISPRMISGDPYNKLKQEAIRFAAATEKRDEREMQDDHVGLFYTDYTGNRALIVSDEELRDAIQQYMESGSIKIVATVSAPSPPRRGLPGGNDTATATPAPFKRFEDRDELQTAVDEYLADGSGTSSVARTYGYPIGEWDVSNVTSFRELFSAERNPEAAKFCDHLTSWDVSNGKDFSGMFRGASSFNSDLSDWDVSSAENTSHMFYYARRFNSDLSRWDVSNVTGMSYMFAQAKSFAGDIARWNVSGVTNMRGMFDHAAKFTGDLSFWDVSNVKDMFGMFYRAESFRSEIRNWNVTNVVTMAYMFFGLERFRDEVAGWDYSNVTDKHLMF